MRRLFLIPAALLMSAGIACAQTSSGTETHHPGTQKSKEMGAPRHKKKSEHGHHPGYTMSNKTSHKGKSSLPGHLKSKKGPVGGTSGSGMPGSGPHTSGSNQ